MLIINLLCVIPNEFACLILIFFRTSYSLAVNESSSVVSIGESSTATAHVILSASEMLHIRMA